MATARATARVLRAPARVSTRVRRTSPRQGPRAPEHLVERMVAEAGLVVVAYTDRLMRALTPLLEERFGRGRQDSARRQDAPSLDEVFDQVQEGHVSREFLARMFRLTDQQAANDLARVVPISPDQTLRGAAEMQAAFIEANTELIQMEERARREVRAIIEGPIAEGVRVEDIRAQIEERMGVVRSRAELIARDQTLKTYGQIQEARQTEAGIEEYTWSTSLDERVRSRHTELEGTTQRWDEPPIVDRKTGRREHPGGDFQCRCAAIPILPTGELPPESESRPSRRAPPPEPTPAEVEAVDPPSTVRPSVRPQAAAAADPPPPPPPRPPAPPPPPEPPPPPPPASGPPPPPSEPPSSGSKSLEQLRLLEERQFAEERAATARISERLSRVTETLAVRDSELGRVASAAIDDAGLSQLYSGVDKLGTLQIEARPIPYRGGRVAGSYDGPSGGGPFATTPATQAAIRVDLSPEILAEFSGDRKSLGHPDLWSVANAAADDAGSVRAAITHEFGHAVHLKDPFTALAAAVDDAVQRAGRIDPARMPRDFISQYAAASPEEYFAEAFTAYRLHPEWLKANAPAAYRMVTEVLRLRGMI